MSLKNADPKVTAYIENSEDFAKPIFHRLSHIVFDAFRKVIGGIQR